MGNALTLRAMQTTDRAELRAIARHAENRAYGAACNLMAHAMDAHDAGDPEARNGYVKQARAYYELFTAAVELQERAAALRIAELKAAGIAPQCETSGVFHGARYHQYDTGRRRDEVSVRDR